MDFENERDQPTEEVSPKRKPSQWRRIGQILLAFVAGGIGYIVGLLTGANYGGNYVPDFSFLGFPGYEGSGLMAGIAAGGTLFILAMGSLLLLRRLSVSSLAIVGGILGMLVGAPLFFAVIAPSIWLLAAVYAGSGLVGALVGFAIGSLASPHRRKA